MRGRTATGSAPPGGSRRAASTSTRPTGGPHCGSAMRRTIIRSMTCCTSSSLSSSTPTRSTVEASAGDPFGMRGLATATCRRARRSARRAAWSRQPAGDRKFSRTNAPRPSPSWSFLRRMIAVCGIGMPSGCLNSAVTANQSASAPTMPASAAARTYPTQAAARSALLRPGAHQKDHRRGDQEAQRHQLHPAQRRAAARRRPADRRRRTTPPTNPGSGRCPRCRRSLR